MGARPRVTIGMPVYNGERYLQQAIDAVLAQTFTDFELVISDNASSDTTPAIARAASAADPRVRYLRYEENRGAAWNFNNTFHHAHGEYFKWQCHDDLLAPPMLQQGVAVLDAHPEVVVVYPQAALIDESGTEIGLSTDNIDLRHPHPHQRLHKILYQRNKGYLDAQFGLVRRAVMATTGLMGSIPHSDEVLMAEFALRGQIWELPDHTFAKRVHARISTELYDLHTLGEFLDPQRRQRVTLVRLEKFSEYMRAVARARLGPVESLRCYRELLGLVFAGKNVAKVAEDLIMAGRKLLRLQSGRGV